MNITYKRMANPHPFFVLLWLLLSYTAGASSSSFNQTVSRAHAETLKLKLANGRNLIRKELQSNSANAAALLIQNQQDFLTLCVQQDPKVYDTLIKAQEERLQQINNLKERSAWVDYSKAEVRLHIALSRLLFDHKLAAAWDIRQAYLQYVANTKRYPSFIPNKKTLGTLQVLIGSVPDTYKVFLNIIGMKGDIKSGMANLREAATKENPFQDEAILLHALLQHLLEQDKNKAAETTISKLSQSHPDNLLFAFVSMHILKKNKRSELALQVYQRLPKGPAYLAFPYLHHMAADLYLYKGDLNESIHENQLFLQQHRGNHYLKAAHFKLYLSHWLQNNERQAGHHYRMIPQVGQPVVEEDAYAARFLEQQTKPNRWLLLSRLHSDGGYYQQALATLSRMQLHDNTPQAEVAEYHYRRARIHHGLQNSEQAKRSYKQAISACGNTTLYFAPHAALQLGYLYQEEKNIHQARTYFNKAIAYKGHEYKSSIDAKAKLALLIL